MSFQKSEIALALQITHGFVYMEKRTDGRDELRIFFSLILKKGNKMKIE